MSLSSTFPHPQSKQRTPCRPPRPTAHASCHLPPPSPTVYIQVPPALLSPAAFRELNHCKSAVVYLGLALRVVPPGRPVWISTASPGLEGIGRVRMFDSAYTRRFSEQNPLDTEGFRSQLPPREGLAGELFVFFLLEFPPLPSAVSNSTVHSTPPKIRLFGRPR